MIEEKKFVEVKSPLTMAELSSLLDEDNVITVHISVGLDDLLDCNLEELNYYMDEHIISDCSHCHLTDINYSVVGMTEDSDSPSCVAGSVLLKVSSVIEMDGEKPETKEQEMRRVIEGVLTSSEDGGTMDDIDWEGLRNAIKE
jgi:hypothetical protein